MLLEMGVRRRVKERAAHAVRKMGGQRTRVLEIAYLLDANKATPSNLSRSPSRDANCPRLGFIRRS